MNPQGLYERLALDKHVLELAAQRFATLTVGVDHPRVDTARGALELTGVALTRAAGGLSPWTRQHGAGDGGG